MQRLLQKQTTDNKQLTTILCTETLTLIQTKSHYQF